MKRLLALDFDGVICDSINECMLVSSNAYFKRSIGKQINFSEIEPILQDRFKKCRYLVGSAKDFYFLWKSLFPINISYGEVIKKYYKLKNDEAGNELSFAKRFYSLRTKIKEDHFSQWILLNPIYKHIKNFLNDFIDIDNLFIVTAKDTDSVVDLLRSNNIDINREQVYGREISLDKVKLFNKIIDETEIRPQNIFYIEDRISHLKRVKLLHVNCYLATWGYTSPTAYEEAINNGIKPITIDQLPLIYPKD